MNRFMRRAARIFVALLPAVASAALTALWAASYGWVAVLAVYPSAALQGVASHSGSVVFLLSDISVGDDKRWDVDFVAGPAAEFSSRGWEIFEPPDLKLSFAGFRLARGRVSMPSVSGHFTAVAVPHAFLVALALLPTAVSLRRAVRRWRWRRQGRCTSCGYDLRSSPSRCPECGADADRLVRGGST